MVFRLLRQLVLRAKRVLAEVCVYTLLRKGGGADFRSARPDFRWASIGRPEVKSKNHMVLGPCVYSFAFWITWSRPYTRTLIICTGLLHRPRSSSKGECCQHFSRFCRKNIDKSPKMRFLEFRPKNADASPCFWRLFSFFSFFFIFLVQKSDFFFGHPFF